MPNTTNQFISPLELSALDGIIGVTFNGIAVGDNSGYSVTSAGDVNGDGFDDVMIGAPYASPGGVSGAGSTYLIFGRATAWSSASALVSLNGANGVVINGVAVGDNSGYSVTSAGDVNGDGVDDLMIGAYGASPGGLTNAGSVYLIFGHTGAWSSPLLLSSLNGTNGVVINGIAALDQSGYSITSAGDVNRDGINDVVVGAPNASPGGLTNAGSVYLIFGHTGAWSSPLVLSSLNGTNGVVINGVVARDQSGYSVALAGDVNGDGIGDIMIGAPNASPGGVSGAGSTYLIFGHAGTWNSPLALGSLNGSNGVLINGIKTYDASGYSVSLAGDMNGDGIGDVLIGANQAAPGDFFNSGSTYLIFGHRGVWGNPLALSSLNGTNGVVINSMTLGAVSGNSVAGGGDMNGDGLSDIVIGAPFYSGSDSNGFIYLIFGHTGDWSSPLVLSNLNGANGVVINGVTAYDRSGYSVASAGDVNGDGIDDVVIGAYNATPGGLSYAGSTYLIFGDSLDLLTNTLTINQGQTIFLDNSMLAASHPRNLAINASIPFRITNVVHGTFSILNFLQSAISQHLVSFTHDGSIYAPSYQVTVGNWAIVSSQAATISFHVPPVLYVNPFSVRQGQTVVLSSQVIRATSVYYPSDELMFSVSNVLYGNFVETNTTIVKNQFNQSALTLGQIAFATDGSGTAPSYYISVSDGQITTSAISGTVNFNTAPILLNNQLTLTPGQQKVILSSNDLSAIGTAIPLGDLVFIPSTVNCHFENLNLPGFSLPQFQQNNIRGSQVLFVWDGYTTPFYNMSVSDGVLHTISQPAVIKLVTPTVNTFTTIEASNNTVRNAIIGGTVSGIISLGFLALRCYLGKRMNGALKNILVVDNATVEQEQEEWKRETLSPVVKEIFDKFKTTSFIGYRNEANTKAYVQGIELLLLKLEKHGVEVHFPKLSRTDRIRLLSAIVDEMKIQLVRPSGVGGFFKPAFTADELKASAVAIAKVVAVSVAKEKTVDKVRHTVVERTKIQSRIPSVMVHDNEIELAASVSEQKLASEAAANQDLIDPSLEARVAAIEGHFAKVEGRFAKVEEESANIKFSMQQLLEQRPDTNDSEKPKMHVVK